MKEEETGQGPEKQNRGNPLEIIETPERLPALKVDVQQFQSYLDDIDISNESKVELLETLWSIVINFVDLGFGIHPVQHAILEKEIESVSKTEREAE